MKTSTLKFENIKLRSAELNGLSSLPPIATKLSLSDITDKFNLDEDDGLFINYGLMESAYPYVYQDMYDRSLKEKDYTVAVLENEYLRATFTPCFGGKLWSLIDKKTGRELLFKNEVVRPCNLGVRNAWLSGGIEWNACFKGHGPYTCDQVNTAVTELDDGTPVLRFYYFERIRCAIVQMDFFLPEGSKYLHARTRLTNPNKEVVPMYWWSNVAAAMHEGDRVIVPAKQSYTVTPDIDVIKIDIPVYNGIDVTYPMGNVTSSDFFWKLEGEKKYIAQLNKDGYGLCQMSNSRLQGRKLFVWGNTSGGDKWCNFLTADEESGKYDEIQCGIAKTQYECLPMPPNTTWEFLEVYGAMSADKAKVHGEDWEAAKAEVERIFAESVTPEYLEETLLKTKKMATSPAKEKIFGMEGWGALENYRREKDGVYRFCSHLDFGELGRAQEDWISLKETGTIGVHKPDDVPDSYMKQAEWTELLKASVLEKDKENWYAHYLLGCAAVAEERFAEAEKHLQASVKLCRTAWGLYALAVSYKKQEKRKEETEYMLAAYELRANDVSLAKELCRCLHENEEPNKLIEIFEGATAEIKASERCLLYYAYALAKVGKIAEAEDILIHDGKCLVVPDVRECELTTSELWFYIQEKKGLTEEEAGGLPYDLDFRMFTKREGWFDQE